MKSYDTYYTVGAYPGYSITFIRPADRRSVLSYGERETFEDKERPFRDPGEAMTEFENWHRTEYQSEPCFLSEAQFRRKVAELHKLRHDTRQKLQAWNAMTTSRNLR